MELAAQARHQALCLEPACFRLAGEEPVQAGHAQALGELQRALDQRRGAGRAVGSLAREDAQSRGRRVR